MTETAEADSHPRTITTALNAIVRSAGRRDGEEESELMTWPYCVTVNVWPPTTMLSVRDAPVFAAAVNATVPLPLPLAPAVMVIHDAPVVAVHVHPAGAVTLKEPVPPAAGMVAPEALSV